MKPIYETLEVVRKWIVYAAVALVFLFALIIMPIFYTIFSFRSDVALREVSEENRRFAPPPQSTSYEIVPASDQTMTVHGKICHQVGTTTGTTAIVVAAEGFHKFIS